MTLWDGGGSARSQETHLPALNVASHCFVFLLITNADCNNDHQWDASSGKDACKTPTHSLAHTNRNTLTQQSRHGDIWFRHQHWTLVHKTALMQHIVSSPSSVFFSTKQKTHLVSDTKTKLKEWRENMQRFGTCSVWWCLHGLLLEVT